MKTLFDYCCYIMIYIRLKLGESKDIAIFTGVLLFVTVGIILPIICLLLLFSTTIFKYGMYVFIVTLIVSSFIVSHYCNEKWYDHISLKYKSLPKNQLLLGGFMVVAYQMVCLIWFIITMVHLD